MVELLRLVDADLPVLDYNPCALGPRGSFLAADTPEGVLARNTMHNRVAADVFVPAGGRPATINEGNWAAFLDGDGAGSSKLVVEGANLFTTPAARQALHETAGVVFIKDSSANKCGVITSSYEILLSMMLETAEFIALKPLLVPDVLDRLRQVARTEAELLFREARLDPSVPLPVVSARISDQITRAHDALSARLAEMTPAEKDAAGLREVVCDHLPSAAQAFLDERFDRVPEPYINAIIAANLASRLVYREGVGYVEQTADAALAGRAMAYRDAHESVEALVEQVRGSGLPPDTGEEIARLLSGGGVRAALELAEEARRADC